MVPGTGGRQHRSHCGEAAEIGAVRAAAGVRCLGMAALHRDSRARSRSGEESSSERIGLRLGEGRPGARRGLEGGLSGGLRGPRLGGLGPRPRRWRGPGGTPALDQRLEVAGLLLLEYAVRTELEIKCKRKDL